MTSGRKPKKQGMQLTDLELQIMNMIWLFEMNTARQVCDELSKTKPLAYTTVATIFKVLEQKKYLQSKKNGNVLQYKVLIPKENYQDWYVSNMLGNIFENPKSLVARLIDDSNLSKKELDKILKTLEKQEF